MTARAERHLLRPRPTLASRRVLLLAPLMTLAACAGVGAPALPYHAFELGVTAKAGTLRHLRWHYGDIRSGDKTVAVGTGIPFTLRRQPMPVPDFCDISWQAADGTWRLAHVPVRGQLRAPVEGHSVLFMVEPDGVRGEWITYTPRGDQRELFARVSARVVDEATAVGVGLPVK
jgi:hypothetical protein